MNNHARRRCHRARLVDDARAHEPTEQIVEHPADALARWRAEGLIRSLRDRSEEIVASLSRLELAQNQRRESSALALEGPRHSVLGDQDDALV
jgi:hypothetical protein